MGLSAYKEIGSTLFLTHMSLFHSPVYEMLRKYLVVLGYSGKRHSCWTTFCSSLIKLLCEGTSSDDEQYLLHLWSHHFNSLFFLPPLSWMVCIFDSISFEATILGVVNISPPCLLCTFQSGSFFFFFFVCPFAYVVCTSTSRSLREGSESCILLFAAEPQQKPFGECDVIIKGSGCPFCYCVSFEMQTLQWIFLWAMNV